MFSQVVCLVTVGGMEAGGVLYRGMWYRGLCGIVKWYMVGVCPEIRCVGSLYWNAFWFINDLFLQGKGGRHGSLACPPPPDPLLKKGKISHTLVEKYQIQL